MAATENLPNSAPVVIDPGAIGMLVEPISIIAESVSTYSEEIDITSTAVKVERTSTSFELGVIAPNRRTIVRSLSKVIGGDGFRYDLWDSGVDALYGLKIFSQIGPLQVMKFAKFLQKESPRLRIYVEGMPVTAL